MESIKETVKARFSSPLFGAFAISWVFINWKILVVLFIGNEQSTSRIAIISEKYINTFDIFWAPLGFSVIFILLYPVISLGVSYLWAWNVPYKKRIIDHINNKIHIDAEELNEIRMVYDGIIAKKDEELFKLNAKCVALTKELTLIVENSSKIAGEKSDTADQNNDKSDVKVVDKLDKECVDILIELGRYDDYDIFKFVNSLKYPQVKTQYNLDRLYKEGYVDKDQRKIELTEKGRAYLVENGFV